MPIFKENTWDSTGTRPAPPSPTLHFHPDLVMFCWLSTQQRRNKFCHGLVSTGTRLEMCKKLGVLKWVMSPQTQLAFYSQFKFHFWFSAHEWVTTCQRMSFHSSHQLFKKYRAKHLISLLHHQHTRRQVRVTAWRPPGMLEEGEEEVELELVIKCCHLYYLSSDWWEYFI